MSLMKIVTRSPKERFLEDGENQGTSQSLFGTPVTDKELARTLCEERLRITKKSQISDRKYGQKTNRPFTKDAQVSVLAAGRGTLSNICQ